MPFVFQGTKKKGDQEIPHSAWHATNSPKQTHKKHKTDKIRTKRTSQCAYKNKNEQIHRDKDKDKFTHGICNFNFTLKYMRMRENSKRFHRARERERERGFLPEERMRGGTETVRRMYTGTEEQGEMTENVNKKKRNFKNENMRPFRLFLNFKTGGAFLLFEEPRLTAWVVSWYVAVYFLKSKFNYNLLC